MKHLKYLSLLFVILSLAVSGCEFGSTGSQGNLQFRDLTSTVPPDLTGHIDQPIAVGARLTLSIKIESDNTDADISSATSDDSGVFVVESSTLGRAVVEATGAGSALLEVATSSGLTDSIALSVSEIANTEVLLLPWSAWLALPDSLWADGAVMLPDSSVDLFALHTNGDDTILTGFGAAEWELTDGVAATITPEESSDYLTLRSAEAGETFSVTTSLGGEFAFETVEETTVASLSIYNQTDEVGPVAEGETLELVAGRSVLLHVAAFTADGDYVIGAGSETFETSISDEDSAVLRVSLSPTTQEEQDVNRVLANGRAFFVEPLIEGTADLTIDWAGQSLTLDVEVAPAETDSDESDPDADEDPESES